MSGKELCYTSSKIEEWKSVASCWHAHTAVGVLWGSTLFDMGNLFRIISSHSLLRSDISKNMNWSAKLYIGSNMSTSLWTDAVLTAFLITVIIVVCYLCFCLQHIVKYSPKHGFHRSWAALECLQTVYYCSAISNFCIPLSKEQTMSDIE